MAHPIFLVLAGSLAAVSFALAADDPSALAEDLVARERARVAVVTALEDYEKPAANGEIFNDNFVAAVERVAEAGPAAVPFLVNELEQGLPATFRLCAYALGRIKTPESEAALRQALSKADAAGGDIGTIHKGWAGWALGLQGQADVLDLFDSGNLMSAPVPMHLDASVFEVAALLTAPASVPVLLAQLDRFAQSTEPRARLSRFWTLRALRRIHDPSAVPEIASVLELPDWSVRAEAARTLGAFRTTEAVAALFRALDDAEPAVRRTAAASLEQVRPDARLPQILERLEKETDPVVRGLLYRVIAVSGGDAALETLRKFWPRPHPTERHHFVDALDLVDSRRTMDLLRQALTDADNTVAVRAVLALSRIGAADELLAALPSLREPPLLVSATELARMRYTKAAPRFAEMLIKRCLPEPVTEPMARVLIEKLSETLVELRYVDVLAELRKATEIQTDAMLAQYLSSVILRLEALRAHGTKVPGWVETLKTENRELRFLAYARLGEIGGEPAARALADALTQATPEDAVEILRAATGIRAAATAELFERVLVSSEFDGVAWLPAREMAGWGARRTGSPRMLAALRSAVDRRQGRDAKVLIYLAVAEGKEALPVLARYRLPRFRYIKWSRAKELEKLDAVAEDLAAGRSLARVDVPPDQIRFQ